MPQTADFTAVFAQLKGLLVPYAGRLMVKADDPGNYCLNTPYAERYKRELLFGAAQVKKRYVSYYLMPIYVFPDLTQGMAPVLRARMQGKSCFNFTAVDEHLLGLLARLTERGFDRFVAEQLV